MNAQRAFSSPIEYSPHSFRAKDPRLGLGGKPLSSAEMPELAAVGVTPLLVWVSSDPPSPADTGLGRDKFERRLNVDRDLQGD
jgi:hypothetical protein